VVVVHGTIAKGPPHSLECACIRIQHDHTMVAVAVSNEHFVGWRVHERIRGAMQILRVGVSLALVAFSDLHDQLAVR
jgi:hypothetical protein